MVIGIDIDDTITNTTLLATEVLQKDDRYKSISDYHTLATDELEKFIAKNVINIENNVLLKDNVVEVLKNFKSKGIKIIFITARGDNEFERLIYLTSVYLNKLGVTYDLVIYRKNHKGKIAEKYGIDIFIDDKEEVLDEMKDLNIKTIRFSDSNPVSKHLVMDNWKTIEKYIFSLLGECNNG